MTESPEELLTEAQLKRLQDFDFPCITKELPGIGGVLKQELEDFIVEEIPVYEPQGTGEHLFLWIEKRDVSGPDLVGHLSRSLNIDPQFVGMAGIKDRRAITRQYVSVPASCEPDLAAVTIDQITVLKHSLHQNKLKTGHLVGNRFSILLRETSSEAYEVAVQIRDELLKFGFPNYFGPQRFGHGGRTVQFGLKSLFRPPGKVRGKRARFELSAVQSWLFNLALAERIDEELFHTALLGDVMQVRKSGGPFVVEDVNREKERLKTGEIAIAGPVFGPKMKMPTDEVQERENRILSSAGLTLNDFARHRKLCAGTRRPYSILPESIEISPEANGLRFQFELPTGCYATTMLREFMKTDWSPDSVRDSIE
ncbi:tRNA pseudouridine synthase D [Polystyrenella longa]|uniref:tRNA pseudouridine synthase D n=1 Tax=Polystyrenella longa TaxID=2528007 RepID=A0A518CQY2_9PLAN|nr:tRNA pseudouridine(13) synthase TruD [Polystyrenella longa]QDU81639.1 tRNA pseudouridine synthase D [Polystyrenella longa]